MGAMAKIGVFCGLIAPKLYVPHQNTHTKGKSFGCLLAPEVIFSSPKIVPFELYPAHKHPTLDSTHFSYLWNLENHLHRNSEIFHRCTHTDTDSHLFFKNGLNLCRTSGRKAAFDRKKTRFGTLSLGGTHGVVSPIFLVCVHTVAPHL